MTTQQNYYYGTGKRKSAIARVRLYPGGSGAMVINGKTLEEALPWLDWQKRASQPFDAIPAAANRFNVVAKIEGGGISAWAPGGKLYIFFGGRQIDPDLQTPDEHFVRLECFWLRGI